MCVREMFPGRIRAYLALLAPLVAATATWGQNPQPPKVPFSSHPCQSLSPADEATLKMPSPIDARPDRAPAKLAFDDMCMSTHAGAQYAQGGLHDQGRLRYEQHRQPQHQPPGSH